MRWRKGHLIIIIGLVAQMMFYAFLVVDNSTYDKYVSGEYYFRARAKTTQPDDSLLWDTSLDMTQTKNILLLSSGAEVYAYNPHGPYCTVDYGEDTVQDFPLGRLKFLTEDDKDVFNGKQYTKEEYDALIEKISGDSSMRKMLSDEKMIPGKHSLSYPLLVLLMSAAAAVVYCFSREDSFTGEIVLTFWVLLSILMDILYANIS